MKSRQKTGSIHMLPDTKMIADYEESTSLDPVMQLQTLPATRIFQKDFCFISHETKQGIFDFPSELVDIEQDTYPILLSFTQCGIRVYPKSPTHYLVILPEHPREHDGFHQWEMGKLLEPTSNKL
ncbi:hypothetical protein Tco_0526623 [Tanacetum coccineum]